MPTSITPPWSIPIAPPLGIENAEDMRRILTEIGVPAHVSVSVQEGDASGVKLYRVTDASGPWTREQGPPWLRGVGKGQHFSDFLNEYARAKIRKRREAEETREEWGTKMAMIIGIVSIIVTITLGVLEVTWKP